MTSADLGRILTQDMNCEIFIYLFEKNKFRHFVSALIHTHIHTNRVMASHKEGGKIISQAASEPYISSQLSRRCTGMLIW